MSTESDPTGGASLPAEGGPETYGLRLHVAGQAPRSVLARDNLRRVRDEHVTGRCRVEVIDPLFHPVRARGDEILAVPTPVRKLPEPMRKTIGDLSDTDRVLVGLQIRPKGKGLW